MKPVIALLVLLCCVSARAAAVDTSAVEAFMIENGFAVGQIGGAVVFIAVALNAYRLIRDSLE